MKRDLKPAHGIGGTLSVPGDKSIAHRAALLSILSTGPIVAHNFPDGEDCKRSLDAARAFGVQVDWNEKTVTLTPPENLSIPPDTIIDCGNSGTTARLLSGIAAGLDVVVTLSGDESLSSRPMKRVIDPLTEMGAELFADEGCLPLKIRGRKLLPFEYHLPVPSAQVKSAVLLAGIASKSSVRVREDSLSRDHTERMVDAIGSGLNVYDPKPELVQDEHDPRKKRLVRTETFKREINVTPQAVITGGEVDIPGDISTASFFMAAAAISGNELTVANVGLNPTRTGFLEYLRNAGCNVKVTDRQTISGEMRGTITVSGRATKARKLSGKTIVGVIDEIPIIAVIAAFANGTTVIRDAAELKLKESDRLQAIADNLRRTGIKCGVLDDGLAIEGGKELTGADFSSFDDHRIAMAFSIASLFLVGPSTIDDDSVVAVSCPEFYDLLDRIRQ